MRAAAGLHRSRFCCSSFRLPAHGLKIAIAPAVSINSSLCSSSADFMCSPSLCRSYFAFGYPCGNPRGKRRFPSSPAAGSLPAGRWRKTAFIADDTGRVRILPIDAFAVAPKGTARHCCASALTTRDSPYACHNAARTTALRVG